jgi:Sigma-70, region 4
VRKRECVVLRFLLGLSEAETAGLLGISVGTVKSQTHKGLRLLRDRLGEQGAEGTPGQGATPGRGATREPGAPRISGAGRTAR